MAFAHHILEDIKARMPLSALVGRDVQLRQRSGQDYWGLSPFAAEKTPSFHVRDDGQFYHCFATGEHGNHFSWLMKIHNLSFWEAVKQLAEETGVALPAPDPQAMKKQEQAKNLFEVMEFVCNWYQTALNNEGGEQARQMIAARKISPAAASRFRIGYAPDNAARLIKAAEQAGITPALLLEAGILREANEAGKAPWPLFRNRLIFPIEDIRGRVIAFGGRYIGDAKRAGVGKYINSPQTPLFDKSHNLYHFAGASEIARKTNRLLVAEGYMDVIALWQAGFGDAVAPLGTAITLSQLHLLWRHIDRPLLCLDGDAAGQAAAIRTGVRALEGLSPGKSLGFVFLPKGEDPDSLIKAHGAHAIEDLLAGSAKSLETILVEHEANKLDLTRPEQKALLEKKIFELTQQIQDETVKRHFRASFKNIFWELNRASFQNHKTGFKRKIGARPNAPILGNRLQFNKQHGRRRAQLAVLAILLNHPSLLEKYEHDVNEFSWLEELDGFRGDLQILTMDDFQKKHGNLLEEMGDRSLISLVPQAAPSSDIKTAEGYLQEFFEQELQERYIKDAYLEVKNMSNLNAHEPDQVNNAERRIHELQDHYDQNEAQQDLEVDRLARKKINN